jgi:4-hydroxy-2-oxoheptanedioate aldolase
VNASGKAAGILTVDPRLARVYLDLGALFVAVGVDTALLVKAARDLAVAFKGGTSTASSGMDSV